MVYKIKKKERVIRRIEKGKISDIMDQRWGFWESDLLILYYEFLGKFYFLMICMCYFD